MITTAGTIIIFILLIAAFIAGILIGSFHTKRKAKFVGAIKNWKVEIEDKYKRLRGVE